MPDSAPKARRCEVPIGVGGGFAREVDSTPVLSFGAHVQNVDVIVVGAGIVGASFALALRDASVEVALVSSRSPDLSIDESVWDSRVYTISPGNVTWLEQLGVWAQLMPERIARIENMRIYGDAPSGVLEFDAYEAGLPALAYVAENARLQSALWSSLEHAPHVTMHNSACVDVAWEQEAARLTLADGSELRASLVVGADGTLSWVRARAGITEQTENYGQLGVVANFNSERDHADVAYQWFRPDGVLAFLPLPGHRISMVWSAPESFAQELLTCSPQALCDCVEQASKGVLGRLQPLTPAAAFPLQRQRVAHLVEPRAALVGDAAHTIHPLAGQGVNLGLRDARTLAQVLIERGPNVDCGAYALLRRYERARKEDIMTLDLVTHGLEKLFSARAVWVAGVRNRGLSLVDHLAPLKAALVRRAIA